MILNICYCLNVTLNYVPFLRTTPHMSAVCVSYYIVCFVNKLLVSVSICVQYNTSVYLYKIYIIQQQQKQQQTVTYVVKFNYKGFMLE